MTMTVEMRVEFWDEVGSSLHGAVSRGGVEVLTLPVAGDLFGPGTLGGGVPLCPPVHHIEHFTAPRWDTLETGEPTTPGAIIVFRGRWPGNDAGDALIADYTAHGWQGRSYGERPRTWS